MRIGLITDQPYRAALGYSIRPKELSLNLSNLGFEMYIFSQTDLSEKVSDHLVIRGTNPRLLPILKKFQAVGYKAFKNPFTSRYLYRQRTLQKLSERLAKHLYNDVKKLDLDILQGEKEICSMAAVILGEQLGIPVVADIHGLLVEEAILCGYMREGSKEFIETQAFISNLLNKSDAILVVSDKLKEYLSMNFRIDPLKIFVIPNGAKGRDIIRQHKAEAKTAVYAGILERWENVELLIRSVPAAIRKNSGIKFQIFGSGSLYSELNNLSNTLKVTNSVDFFGLVPYNDIPVYLSKCDIGLFPSSLDITRQVSCPLKLFEYLSIGLPVVTVNGLWWSDFVKRNNIGIVAEANPDDYGAAISQLISDPDEINIMSDNAINLIRKEYSWTYLAKLLSDVYKLVSLKGPKQHSYGSEK